MPPENATLFAGYPARLIQLDVTSSDDDFSAVAQRRTSRLEPKMNIDPPLLSAVSSLIGALMGGGASLTPSGSSAAGRT
jgi:hypothetical protein